MVGSSVPGRAEFLAGRRVVRQSPKAVRALHLPPGGYENESGGDGTLDELNGTPSEDEKATRAMLRARNRAEREGLRLAQQNGKASGARRAGNRNVRAQARISQPAGGQRFGHES